MLLHPLIVHFAIALLSVAVMSDLLFLVTKKNDFWQISNFLLIIGTIGAIAAVLTGIQAQKQISVSPDLEGLVRSHENSGKLTMLIFIAYTGLRLVLQKLRLFDTVWKWVYYITGIIALILLFRTGLLGGEMVYIHGIGIEKSAEPDLEKPSFNE